MIASNTFSLFTIKQLYKQISKNSHGFRTCKFTKSLDILTFQFSCKKMQGWERKKRQQWWDRYRSCSQCSEAQAHTPASLLWSDPQQQPPRPLSASKLVADDEQLQRHSIFWTTAVVTVPSYKHNIHIQIFSRYKTVLYTMFMVWKTYYDVQEFEVIIHLINVYKPLILSHL